MAMDLVGSGSDTWSGIQAENKAALQKELSLPERPEVPLIGFIGRLDYQKGADLVLGAVPWLLDQDVQLVCLGTGDVSLEVCCPNHSFQPEALLS